MTNPNRLEPILAVDVPPRARPSVYPAPFAQRMTGREKRSLGEHFGLSGFGVNLTRLEPGAQSALLHAHSVQDEFLYVLEGQLTVRVGSQELVLGAGACLGFRAGGPPHQLVNRSSARTAYLEIGDRRPGDTVSYPEDDLLARWDDGAWRFTHRDGTPW